LPQAGKPADGANLDVAKTDAVTLQWEQLCGADCYEVDLYKYCAECPDEKINVVIPNTLWDCDEKDCTEETCIVIDDLDPGTTYYWRVRVCIGEPTLSKWSDLRTFTTALPVVPYLCSPECGADGVILNPNFSWTAVKDADSYEVQIATDEAFTDAVTGTPMVNAWMGAPELDYGTVYYWKVRAVKDGVYSDWAVCIFTTAEEPPPEVWISPFTGEKFYSAAEYAGHVAEWEAKQAATPAYIWVIVAIGALLMIAVIILIVRTRRVA